MNRLIYVLLITISSYGNEKIKIYNWWDYIDVKVLNELKVNGYDTEVIVYTSNTQSLARLYRNQDEFDFAIVSKLVMDTLGEYDVFDKKTLRPVIKGRRYNKLTSKKNYCLPYLWGPTVFVSNNKKLNSVKGFYNKDVEKYIVDDPLEFFSMFRADGICDENQTKCYKNQFNKIEKIISRRNFKSDLSLKEVDKSFIYYGWLGAVKKFEKIDLFKNFTITIPIKPVIGQDYLCLLKKSKMSKQKLLKYAELITSKKNSSLNEKKSGYFSPYMNQLNKSITNIDKIKKQFDEKVEKGEYIYLPTVKNPSFLEVQKVWTKIRYE